MGAAALGYLYKQSFERRKITRVTLYYLLEMHHRLARCNYGLSRFSEDYTLKIENRLAKQGRSFGCGEREKFLQVTEKMMQAFMLRQLDGIQKELSEPYRTSLAALAKEDPILAFELKGKESIEGLVSPLDHVTEVLGKEMQTEMSSAEKKYKNQIDEELRRIILQELRLAVRKTAWHAGFIFWIRSLMLLRQNYKDHTPAFLDRLVEQLLDGLPIGVDGIFSVRTSTMSNNSQ